MIGNDTRKKVFNNVSGAAEINEEGKPYTEVFLKSQIIVHYDIV